MTRISLLWKKSLTCFSTSSYVILQYGISGNWFVSFGSLISIFVVVVGAIVVVVVVVVEKPHQYFVRDSENIFIELTVSYPDAVFGNKIEIPTLDGKSTLKIPPGIQSGKLLRMRGKGFPMLRSSSKGDQIVRVVVETPSSVSRGSKKIIESLRDELSPIKNPYSKIDL